MPSPISHIAAGVIIYRSLPAEERKKVSGKIYHIPLLAIIVLAASLLPDLDAVLGIITGDMGAYHNQASNSLFTGIAVAFILGVFLHWWLKGKFLFWFGLIFVSYAAHVFLDMLTVGRGIMLFWPFSSERFISPFLVFYGLRWSHGLWNISHLWTVISEIGFWSAVFGLVHVLQKRKRVQEQN
jgi:membrane-bound metal-dependent hydrolase YbcI (DUF457 family)